MADWVFSRKDTRGDIAGTDGLSGPGQLTANGDLRVRDDDLNAIFGTAPTVDSYASAVVDLAAAGADQVLVAVPGANKQIWVYGLSLHADTGAGTIVLQDSDDTALTGTIGLADGDNWQLAPSPNYSMPWIKVATNKGLEADTGGLCTVDGIITYAIVSV